MFGYIRPDKPELKMKEYDTFKGYYCGLCKELKKEYTFFSRMFLNYDCTFLSLVLSAASDEPLCFKRQACSFSPLKKKNIVFTKDAKFAAAINVILARNSIIDHIKDERKYYLYPLLLMLNRGYKKSKRDFPVQAQIIETSLAKLSELESKNESNIDKVADVFACMMGNLLKSVCKSQQQAYYHLGYHVGRWIYIIDAFDDLEKDYKKKSFNPILLKYNYNGEYFSIFRKKIFEEIDFSLIYSLSEVAKAFELLKIYKHHGLLENIIYSGVKKKTQSVLLKGEL